MRTLALLASLALAPSLAACASSSDSSPAAGGDPANPFEEVVALGAAKYLGAATTTATTAPAEGVTTYEFDPASGPLCLHGKPYRVSVRDTGSDDLFIFLQGGGACWSTFCLAVNEAPAGIPKLDILDATRATNPLRDTSLVYLPYCDGSFFAGDASADDDHDGKADRIQHGLQNLSAALDVARQRFPHPKRVVLAGSSGGGYGAILATILVRTVYPAVPLDVFDDSGPGLGHDGDPSYVGRILDELAIRPLLPASCADCTGNGHITRLVEWELARDPGLRFAQFSSYEDYVLSDIFLGVTGAAYHTALVAETSRIHDRFPDRYRRFLVAGGVHTSLLGTPTGIVGSNLGAVDLPAGATQKLLGVKLGGIDSTVLRGVSIASWFGAMIRGDEAWDDRTE